MLNAFLFGFLFACGTTEKDTGTAPVDGDGDGFVEADDCDDANADINPDAEEICDGVDNNCDEVIDEDASDQTTYYADSDSDGYGDAAATMDACELPDGYTDNMDDCDDASAEVHPEAVEICDSIDNDCDELIDDDDDDTDLTTGMTYYEDLDVDGLGDPLVSMMACAMPDGYVENTDDCDDTDPDIGATDVDGDGVLECRGDCDDADADVGATDVDGDGFVACVDDCDDNDANTFPGAADLEAMGTACMRDADDDGYGDINVSNCATIELFDTYGDSWNGSAHILDSNGTMYTVNYDDDCVDETVCTLGESYIAYEVCATDAPISFSYVEGTFTYENAVRITDSEGMVWEFGSRFTDDQGNELPDLADEQELYTLEASAVMMGTDCDDADAAVGTGDSDGDGYDACDTENPRDCDDSDAAINPSVDADGDGFDMCVDCDEANIDINPDAEEIWYDGVDQNCDGWSDFDMDMDGSDAMMYIDPADGVTEMTGPGYDCDDSDDTLLALAMEADPTACYEDADGDGYGDDDPSSWDMDDYGVIAGTDCHDSSYNGADIYPGAAYNEPDIDGDGVDDCTADEDGDGYGDSDNYYGVNGTDCDDSDELLNPGIDGDGDGANSCEDCDDTDAAQIGVMAYYDDDEDGYGSDAYGWLCDLDTDGDTIPDYADNGDDCDDDDELLNPGIDEDGDGSSVCDDCDDEDGFTFPGAGYNEAAPLNEECLTDADGDGYAYGFSGECFTFEVTDSYGDGWNGNKFTVVVDGVDQEDVYNQNITSGIGIETETVEVCVSNGSTMALLYTSGSFPGEISGSITNELGMVVTFSGSGYSASSASVTFDYDMDGDGNPDVSESLSDGDSFMYTDIIPINGTTVVGGTDSDDSDASSN